MTTYQCFGCDRTTQDESLVIMNLRTGKLYCHECMAFQSHDEKASA